MKKNRIKNNLIYYWSVVARITTGLVCHIIHFGKTGKLPCKRPKYSPNEIREELIKIAEEIEMKEKRPQLRVRSLESRILGARPMESMSPGVAHI